MFSIYYSFYFIANFKIIDCIKVMHKNTFDFFYVSNSNTGLPRRFAPRNDDSVK